MRALVLFTILGCTPPLRPCPARTTSDDIAWASTCSALCHGQVESLIAGACSCAKVAKKDER